MSAKNSISMTGSQDDINSFQSGDYHPENPFFKNNESNSQNCKLFYSIFYYFFYFK